MEALSARSYHCRASGYRLRGMTVVLGGMDVARAKPKPWPRGRHVSTMSRWLRRWGHDCCGTGWHWPQLAKRALASTIWIGDSGVGCTKKDATSQNKYNNHRCGTTDHDTHQPAGSTVRWKGSEASIQVRYATRKLTSW